ncbi:MAG: tRNA dihydrouridine synthase DusB [Candidatus Cloacimonetes bacterium]|nr:tRNA dihydrouridine synthase DusB [Candidatus Cloacimonadota bacterium]
MDANVTYNLQQLTAGKIWLAPLAGLTDMAFRCICKETGADVMISEMVSADGLVRNLKPCLSLTCFEQAQQPLGIQLFGADIPILVAAAEIIINLKPAFLDINMGCPVKKVIRKGAGAALMNNPEKAGKIITALKDITSRAGIFLSAKIRAGWDNHSINAIEFASHLADAGLDMIILHPRTRSQFYRDHGNWDLIRQLKQAVTIPVIGNGDIKAAADALRMFRETGCDAVMIGRGAVGNPHIFRQTRMLLDYSKDIEIKPEEKLNMIFKHIELSRRYKGENIAIRELKPHLLQYVKGLPGCAEVRNRINRSIKIDEIKEIISGLFLEKELQRVQTHG